MKKLIFLSLFIFSAAIGHSQIIKGKVLDYNTRKGVAAAYIYFNGTMAVALSDKDGSFELNISKYKDMPLIVSAIGYHTETITDPGKVNPLTVLLKQKTYQLGEIKVVAKNSNRRKYMQIFKDEFLGPDYEYQNCKIENEEDISFNYNNCKDTLEAYAMNPIRINIKRLGYRITFHLDVFKYSWKKKETIYGGNYLFTDTTHTDSTLRPKYQKERFRIYQGSRMHFLRSLWTFSLAEENFIITNYNRELLNYNDVVSVDSGKKYLYYPKDIFVGRKNDQKRYTFSRINFLQGKTYFNPEGYYDVFGIRWAGQMVNQRVADFLPYEYQAIDPDNPQPVKRSIVVRLDNQTTMELGNADMECIYKYTINAPLIKRNTFRKKLETYTTMLQFNESVSRFSDWNLYQADSIRQYYTDEQLAKDQIKKEYNKHLGAKYVFNSMIFKNYPKGKISSLEQMHPDEYIYEENKAEQIWKLKKGTLTVCGYPCKKATTKWGGRTWTVWYAPDIKSSEGPWKLYGLPGLILKADESTKTHQFEATSIRKTNRPIMMPVNSNLTWIQKIDFMKIKSIFEKDYIRKLPVVDNTEGESMIVNGKRFPIGSDTEYCPLEIE